MSSRLPRGFSPRDSRVKACGSRLYRACVSRLSCKDSESEPRQPTTGVGARPSRKPGAPALAVRPAAPEPVTEPLAGSLCDSRGNSVRSVAGGRSRPATRPRPGLDVVRAGRSAVGEGRHSARHGRERAWLYLLTGAPRARPSRILGRWCLKLGFRESLPPLQCGHRSRRVPQTFPGVWTERLTNARPRCSYLQG